MTDDELYALLITDYNMVAKIPGRGFCGIRRQLFTWGLFYGLTGDIWNHCQGRYCYNEFHEAVSDLVHWTGEGDPPGDWLKHFGIGKEYPNPNNLDQRQSTAS